MTKRPTREREDCPGSALPAPHGSGDLEITLYWEADDNSTIVRVRQPATNESISFPVAATRALEAFYDPFAHLAEQQRPLPYGLQLS